MCGALGRFCRRLAAPPFAVDTAAAARAALVWVWLAFLALVTVRVDPAGRARRPIPVRVGRARAPAAVCLVSAATPLQLRLVANFWRSPHDHTCRRLRALLARHGAGPAVDVSGVVVARDTGGPPLAFRLRMTPGARAGDPPVYALSHARGGGDPDTGATVCEHAPAPAPVGSAAVADLLAPLLGRRTCPALMAGGPGKTD